MRHPFLAGEATREELLAWYRRARQRTRDIFDLVAPDAYYDRPIPLRNPIVFYEGHLPAFSVNTLVKRTYGRSGIDPRLEVLFARGIDPEDASAAVSPTDLWPSREQVHAYAAAADALVEENLSAPDQATLTILEHELMHQETLLYMLHALPFDRKVRTEAFGAMRHPPAIVPGTRDLDAWVAIDGRTVTIGSPAGTFGWDNEFPALEVDVAAFSIQAHNVTNGAYLEYMHVTRAEAPHFWSRAENGDWCWRGMFELLPLALDAPVYVTHEEAAAFARWKGARLPTEAEYELARGEDVADLAGNFDFQHLEPVPAGSYAPNHNGLFDLVGNGWEWTSTLFAPFPGFQPMAPYPEYSADFFDEAHYVLKGASPVTARELARPSFRNWFRPAYPYVFASFRCAR